MIIRKHILCFFLFLTTTAIIAEDVSGRVTSENGEAVSFASIYLKNKNIGIISDIHGRYLLPIDILAETNDTLVFSSIGYVTQKIPVVLFAKKVLTGDTNIEFVINRISLPEVTITPNAHQPKDYGLYHLRSAMLSFAADPSEKHMVFVENTDGIDKIIQTVNVRITGNNNGEIEKIRVFFYQKNEHGFQNINVANEDIFITDFSKSKIRHNVSKYRILFPKEGIYVGIEWIGVENRIKDRAKKMGLGVSATTKVKKSHSWAFMEEQWGQFPPEMSEEEKKSIPRLFRKMILNANFQIGITAY